MLYWTYWRSIAAYIQCEEEGLAAKLSEECSNPTKLCLENVGGGNNPAGTAPHKTYILLHSLYCFIRVFSAFAAVQEECRRASDISSMFGIGGSLMFWLNWYRRILPRRDVRTLAHRCHFTLIITSLILEKKSFPSKYPRAKRLETGHKVEPVHRANNYVFPVVSSHSVPQPRSH